MTFYVDVTLKVESAISLFNGYKFQRVIVTSLYSFILQTNINILTIWHFGNKNFKMKINFDFIRGCDMNPVITSVVRIKVNFVSTVTKIAQFNG